MCGMDHGIRLAINILGGAKTARVAARVSDVVGLAWPESPGLGLA